MAMRRELRVGIFTLVGLSVIGLVIFLIGDARRLFETKTSFHTSFQDVQGLVPGSPVRMGGVDIGRVEAVQYPDDPQRSDIVVTVSVVDTEARRVRTDSVATISPKGMLGDKLLTISVGSPEKPRLQGGEFIPSKPGDDLFNTLGALGEKAEVVVGNLEKTTGSFAEPDFRGDIQASAAALRRFLEGLDTGEGYVPRLIKDKDEAERLSRAVENLEETSRRLNQVLAQTNQAVQRVNQGPGLVHELIYGEDGAKAAEQIGTAAEELALTLRGIREGDGLAHQFLYGGEDSNTAQFAEDLAAISSDLRVLVRQVREGKGTLGALMVDPSVYEDLKVLLGNVQRNEVLRALVRYSIRRDEQRPRVEVPDPEPPSGQAELEK